MLDGWRTVADTFSLGPLLATPTFVARGAMGEVWRLDTPTGAWAGKALFEWVDVPARPRDIGVQLAAHAAGVRLPLPILTADGDAVVDVGGRRYRVYEWVDLDRPLALPATPARAAEAGGVLGRLHRLPLAVEGEVDEWYTTASPAEELAALGEHAAASGRGWATAYAEVLAAVERLRTFVSGEHAPPRVCHRDIDPSNLLPSAGDGPVVVLDWENAGPLAPDEELAASMRTWATGEGGRVRADSAMAFLHAYREAGGDAVFDPARSWSMAVCTAVNFLAAMAEQARADDEHRAFAEGRLQEMCGGGLRDLLTSIETLTPFLA